VIDDPVLNDMVLMAQNHAIDLYETLLEKGVAREVARDILPLSTQTTLYMKGSVRSWIHYLQLRCAEDTQKEHREIAEAIRDIFAIQFPTIAKAL
jgi:thymidylate synthase (FAD)